MFKIQYFDNISVSGITQFSKGLYTIGRQISDPDAIILRSKNIFEINLPSNLLVVGRAGVGVNNIPVKRLTSLGIPVFNTPGANANAVKELVLAALLMAGLDGIKNKIHPGDAMDKDLYDLPPEEEAAIPQVCYSLDQALDSLNEDRAFLTDGGVFTDDMIDAYIELKMEEVTRLRMETHPAEFDLYYSV
jgi:hypothetical protein